MSDEYTLTVDMATVDSLGRNLYSNAAAVLSEFVANAWDADANNVSIDYSRMKALAASPSLMTGAGWTPIRSILVS